MALSKETIDHIAHLARIDLSSDEKNKITGDLNKILDYVDLLNEIEVENVEPLVNIVKQKTPLREDIVTESLTQHDALKNAPEKNSDYFKVPKVLNQ